MALRHIVELPLMAGGSLITFQINGDGDLRIQIDGEEPVFVARADALGFSDEIDALFE